jgi:ATP-binding cassette, subfamily B, bacterial
MQIRFPKEHQLDKMDCGPTCLKIVSKYYGRYYSLALLRDLCGTTREGVSISNITNGAERIGLKTRVVKCSVKQLSEEVPLPCIVHWKSHHFVVVYKIKKNRIYISDPASGLVSYPLKEFTRSWLQRNSKKGVVIGLQPEADFHELDLEDHVQNQKSYRSVLGYFRPYRKNILTLVLIMLFATALQASLPFITRAIIDVGVHTSDVDFINIMLIAHAVILISITFSNAVRDWITMHLTARINISLISDYLVKLMKMPITFFENKLIGDILQRAQDHQRIRDFIMGSSLNLVFSSITFLVFSIILFIFDRTIFWCFTGGSMIYLGWVLGFLEVRKRLDTNYFGLMAKDQSYWVETISSMQDIKVNNYEQNKRWKWENLQAKLYKVNVKLLSVTNFQTQGAQLIDGMKNLLITVICAKSVISGEMTFGIMVSTLIIIGMLNGPLHQFIQFAISAQVARISLKRINEIHALPDEENHIDVYQAEIPRGRDIRADRLTFQYVPKSPFVIQNVSFIIPTGKITAIVGDSGSGKTTLLKIILRLYEPTYGNLHIGNLNLGNVSLKKWRKMCGVVLQDGKIFNDTVLNNIVLGAEEIDHDLLERAVSLANINHEIESMPKGYSTKLGEQGRGMSGGQKQRILIARALYKNPEFLFLDEATNALDTINEKKIVDALEEAFIGRTVVIIAHRLSTIRKADQIIVMKNGRISEIGSHESLIEKRGHYYDLVSTQAALI